MAACPTTDPLSHLAERVAGDPYFLAHFLARSGQGERGLARRLGIGPEVLRLLALCAAPRTGDQCDHIAERYGADPAALRRLCGFAAG